MTKEPAEIPLTAVVAKETRFSIRRHVIAGAILMIGLVGCIGGWAATAELSGAVIAPGTVVVERHVKKVQHRDGGVVSIINVKNGQEVEAGDVLLRLDDTQVRAEMNIIQTQLVELRARSARLRAERDSSDEMKLPTGFEAYGEHAKEAARGEKRQFEENRKSRESQKAQLRLRVEQLEDEIRGLTAQRDAKKRELSLIEKELDQVRSLNERNLTPISRVYAMEREANRLGGEHGSLISQIARARGQINEVEVQLLSIDQSVKMEAQRELRTLEARLAELAEREIAVSDRLDRVELRAPISGLVHELSVHTIGGVVTPAEQILLIVPAKDALIVEARFSPRDIDQITVGRDAVLSLSSLNQKDTPQINGKVVYVSADVTRDQQSGLSYYLGRISIDSEHSRHLVNLKLLPGMPVEVFVSTGERTALSYLVKPFVDQMNRAFRE